MKTHNDKTIYARVSKSTLTALDKKVRTERAERLGFKVTRSDLIREALLHFLKRRKLKRRKY